MLSEDDLDVIDACVDLLKDINCGWTAAQLQRVLDKLEPCGLTVTLPGPDGEPNVELPLYTYSPYESFYHLTQEWDG